MSKKKDREGVLIAGVDLMFVDDGLFIIMDIGSITPSQRKYLDNHHFKKIAFVDTKIIKEDK